MRLEGSLDGFSLADIFQLLSFTRKTGALHLRRTATTGEVAAVVYAAGGAVTGASSDLRTQALGRRLVGGGHVDDEAIAAAVYRAASEPSISLVGALREADAVDESVLREQASEQVHDAVFELLRWPDGDFSFVIDEPNPDELGVALPFDDVLAEGRRRLAALAGLTQTIPAPDTVLTISLSLAREPELDRDEWSLLALVDGRRTVAELAALTGRGDFAVLAPLSALVERGLLQAGPDGGGAATLVRRQSVLARLEQRGVVPAEPVASVSPFVPAPRVDVRAGRTDVPAGRNDAPAGESDAHTPRVDSPAAAPRRAAGRTHPEPGFPRPAGVGSPHERGDGDRATQHADDRPGVAASGEPSDGSAAARSSGRRAARPVAVPSVPVQQGADQAADQAPYQTPDRDQTSDPGLDKELLMRLIAGVRGL